MASSFSVTLPLLSSLLFLSVISAQQSRAPHGLAFQNPMSLSPSAFEFFHPNHTPPAHHHASAPCTDPQCTHLAALSALSKARADPVQHPVWSAPPSGGGIRAGGAGAIVLGLAFVVLVATGIMVKRRANSQKGQQYHKA